LSPADDEPTRQVPPARPRQPKAGGAGAVPPTSQPHVRTWEEELADRIASLKSWVVMLGILSIAALGVAAYAAVAANDNSSSDTGVTKSQIRELESRISDLEDNSTSDATISQLKSDVSDLSEQVNKLQSESSGSDSVSPSDFQTLQQQVSDLSQQVADLQDQSGQ
jgi:polyhydroxyalkanoate synthesis regulator phasin